MTPSGMPLLRLSGIHKRFPGVRALKGVSFELRPGEVHALAGENGAGKSTLIHILAGVQQPDDGDIELSGRPGVRFADERAAQEAGIAIVFQERSLFSTLNVAENIFAGRQPVGKCGRIRHGTLWTEASHWLDQVGMNVSPRTLLGELSPAQQQMVEIAKALSLRARVILFDEPTAALTDTETQALFRIIRQLKTAGVGIIYITHRLEEIFEIADRVTVLKDGEGQGTRPVQETTPEELVAMMVGREIALHQRHADKVPESNPVILEARAITDASALADSRPFLNGVGFKVRRGEILAWSGLAGAGRTELALSLFGARPRASGQIFLEGQAVTIRSPRDAIAAGIGYVPEDRKESGLFLEMTLSQNVAAARLQEFGSWWFRDRESDRVAEDFRRKLRIACHSVRQIVQTLSGGNQQKIVLSRWLLAKPKVLIVDEPTRGIDVGAKAEVHALLHELARGGTAVIVISSDLPEVLAVAGRILVMREGRVTGEVEGEEATEETLMRMATLDV